MNKVINWGIIGPGKIAHKFAAGFDLVDNAKLYAIASRDAGRGKVFAEKFNVPVQYSQYADIVNDPAVDIIYIATPHTFHHLQTLFCLHHKKAVLCEKPLTLNYRNASEMVSAARASNTFLMEGMWSRFFPATIKTADLVRAGEIGDILLLRADFGFAAPHNPENRVLNLQLGGGAQLDVGVYPMFLALLLLGKPDKIQVSATLASTGADETTAVQFHFKKGGVAQISSSIAAETPKQADIVGTLGSITVHAPWHKSQLVTLKRNTGETESFEFPFEGFGFNYEIQEVTNLIIKNEKESALMSLDFSLLMAEVADEILKQANVVYPAI
jgi:predicted dehydrogenase